MKLSKEAIEYVEAVSQQTGSTEQMVVESALGFVATLAGMAQADQEIVKSLVEKYAQKNRKFNN